MSEIVKVGDVMQGVMARMTKGAPTTAAEIAAQMAQRRENDQRRAAQERLEANVRAAGVPLRYANASFADFERGPSAMAQEWARHALHGEFRQLLVLGPVGTGKTHLAAATALWLAGRGCRTVYSTAAGYLRAIRETWGSREKSEGQVISRFVNAHALVLDDIGAGTDYSNDVWRLHELIDMRYADMKPTAFVSNLTAKELSAFIGARAYDRMRHDALTCAMVGQSRRAKA